jgi:hypothetical protein
MVAARYRRRLRDEGLEGETAMSAITKILAGGAAIAALASAAPAAAQYYPGYGYGYGGNPIGQVINQVFGGGYGGYGYGGYGVNSQAVVNQCAAAVQARLVQHSYGGYGYGYGYGAARVLGISRLEPRGDGGIRVRGIATSGSGAPDLTFSCKTDGRGFIRDVDVDPAYRSYGNGYSPYNPYDYSQYGYRRY